MPQQLVRMRLLRREGANIQVGQFIAYMFEGIQFAVFASRYGVEIKGEFPLVGEQGINTVKQVLDRAVAHHKHLATFPIGSPQYILSEEEIESRLTPVPAVVELPAESTKPFNAARIIPISGKG